MRFTPATSVFVVLFSAALVQAQVPSGVPNCHAVCPEADISGFAVSGSGSIDANSVATCSYPGFPGDGLSNFWCSYDTAGTLVVDHNMGACPHATATTGCVRRRTNVVAQVAALRRAAKPVGTEHLYSKRYAALNRIKRAWMQESTA